MTGRLVAGSSNDTIFALASGAGRSAIAIIRISGTGTREIVRQLCGRALVPRMAQLVTLVNGRGEILDQALVLWMPGPRSYTGEDSAELQVHGGPAVLAAVTDALLEAGARPADPGEFTRRAFLGGKMDLLAAEAVADLVDSETDLQRVHALQQLSGEQADVVAAWSVDLTRCLALQEALIDFADDDVPHDVDHEITAVLTKLCGDMRRQIQAGARAERLRRGLVFVITGAPNVGKSSLLNALVERPLAIVSPQPGTTRDAVRAELVLGGIPVSLIDTAGLRETEDPIENEGVQRALASARDADFTIAVIDAGRPLEPGFHADLCVANKVDVAEAPSNMLGVSALTGAGLLALREKLTHIALELAHPGTFPPVVRARHMAAVGEALTCLESAQQTIRPELRAEDFRQALRALGRLTGVVESEAVLDLIFGTFCIGK